MDVLRALTALTYCTFDQEIKSDSGQDYCKILGRLYSSDLLQSWPKELWYVLREFQKCTISAFHPIVQCLMIIIKAVTMTIFMMMVMMMWQSVRARQSQL